MPAKSKKQFRYIQYLRSLNKNKAKAPKKRKWAYEKGWTKGVNYKSLKESITPKFNDLYCKLMNCEEEK